MNEERSRGRPKGYRMTPEQRHRLGLAMKGHKNGDQAEEWVLLRQWYEKFVLPKRRE